MIFTSGRGVNELLTDFGIISRMPDMGKERTEDPAMKRVLKLYEDSGMTQQELGEKMGYGAASARQAVSQFLKSGDPQISMLRRFAKAVGVKIETIVR